MNFTVFTVFEQHFTARSIALRLSFPALSLKKLALSFVVGYQGTELKANTFYMITAQFDDVAGKGVGMTLNDLVKGVPFETELQIQSPEGGYDIYYYMEEALDVEADEFVEGWADGFEELTLNKIAPGTTFWLKAPSACTATIAGQVLADSSKTVSIAGGKYTMIGNPYPAAVNPNTLEWAGLTYDDELQVLSSEGGYDIYYWMEEALDVEADEFVEGWADGFEELVVESVIPAGQGAWMKPAAAVTVEWVSPIK